MEDNNKDVYRSVDELFFNSKAVFVEYHDVIKNVWFASLIAMLKVDRFEEIFNLTELKSKTEVELYNWYLQRKNRNFLKDIENYIPEKMGDDFFDEFLNNITHPEFYEWSRKLNVCDSLSLLSGIKGMVKKFYVYSEFYTETIEHESKDLFGDNCIYLYGPWEKVVEDLPEDATFFLSDISKLHLMCEKGKLTCASIVIPEGYTYNDNKINEEELFLKVPYKLDYFNNLISKDI